MALQITTSVYGRNGNDYKNGSLGKTMSFPTQGIRIEALSPAVSYNGVACNTQVVLLPTGLVVNENFFYTPAVTATLITASNA